MVRAMEAVDPSPSRVLVLRVWIEGGATEGLRIRIVSVEDLVGAERMSVVAADVDEALAIVRRWIEAFLHSAVTGA
jgi:hypothetical protein